MANEIVIEISADSHDAENSVKRVRRSLRDLERRNVRTLSDSLRRMSREFARAGLIMTGVGTAIAGGAFLLGKSGAEITAVSDAFEGLANKAGTSKDALLQALTEASGGTISAKDLMVGALAATAAGITPSTETLAALMVTARDSAREMGLTTQEAFQQLVGAVKAGSDEAFAALGITINAEDAFKEYAKTIRRAPADFTPAERAQALLNIALADADKKFRKLAFTTPTASEQFQRFSTRARDARDQLAIALLPAVQALLPVLTGLINKLATIAGWFGKLPKPVQMTVIAFGGGLVVLGSFALALGGILSLVSTLPALIGAASVAVGAFGAVFTIAMGPIGLIALTIAGLIAAGVALWKNWDTISEKLSGFWNKVKSDFRSGVNFLIGLAEGFANQWIGAINALIGALNKIKFSIPSWVPGIGGKGFGINIPTVSPVSLPRLATGGAVTRPGMAVVGERGPETVALPRGASVMPLPARGAASGVLNLTVNLNVPPGAVIGIDNLEGYIVRTVRNGVIAGGFHGVLRRA